MFRLLHQELPLPLSVPSLPRAPFTSTLPFICFAVYILPLLTIKFFLLRKKPYRKKKHFFKDIHPATVFIISDGCHLQMNQISCDRKRTLCSFQLLHHMRLHTPCDRSTHCNPLTQNHLPLLVEFPPPASSPQTLNFLDCVLQLISSGNTVCKHHQDGGLDFGKHNFFFPVLATEPKAFPFSYILALLRILL